MSLTNQSINNEPFVAPFESKEGWPYSKMETQLARAVSQIKGGDVNGGMIVINNTSNNPAVLGEGSTVATENGIETVVGGELVPNDISTGNIKSINTDSHSSGVSDQANFAGQTDYGNEPIGFIRHHYTNGNVMQVDNVGENNVVLGLKNARNPTRRSDKGIDFVGTGIFLQCERVSSIDPYPEEFVFGIDDNGHHLFGLHEQAMFQSSLPVDNAVAPFRFQTVNTQTTLMDFKNGGSRDFEITTANSKARLVLSAIGQSTDGIEIRTLNGHVVLSTQDATGRIDSYDPVKLPVKTIATLPSSSTFQHCYVTISDPAGGKSNLVYSNGTNWIYTDQTVV